MLKSNPFKLKIVRTNITKINLTVVIENMVIRTTTPHTEVGEVEVKSANTDIDATVVTKVMTEIVLIVIVIISLSESITEKTRATDTVKLDVNVDDHVTDQIVAIESTTQVVITSKLLGEILKSNLDATNPLILSPAETSIEVVADEVILEIESTKEKIGLPISTRTSRKSHRLK